MCWIKTQTELIKCRRRVMALEERIAVLEAMLDQTMPPDPPEIYKAVSNKYIWAAFAEIFPEYMRHVYISDAQYKVCHISDIRRFVEWSNVNVFPYQREWHDCDDFAFALVGEFSKYPEWSAYPVALIWSSWGKDVYHAYVCVVAMDDDGVPRVYYIEPQNDWEIARESVEGQELCLLVI